MLAARQVSGANLGGRPRLVRCHGAIRSPGYRSRHQHSLVPPSRDTTPPNAEANSLVQVTAGDGSPARDRDVVHVADERRRGLREVCKGVCRTPQRVSGVSPGAWAQGSLQQTLGSTFNVPHVPAPAVGWA